MFLSRRVMLLYLALLNSLAAAATVRYGAADAAKAEKGSKRQVFAGSTFSDSYLLSPTFPRGAEPTLRNIHLELTQAQAAPDGYGKEIFQINGQMPGPLVEVNEGDTLRITVKNSLSDNSTTSMHWHGIRQNGTQSMDGVPGFSQCPIPAGQSYTYVFDTAGQSGTFWYHSHTSTQYTDGALGPLVIHPRSKEEGIERAVAAEVVILLQDWYHDSAQAIAEGLVSSQGYKGAKAAPAPQSGLINGQGVFDCRKLQNSRQPSSLDRCKKTKYPRLTLPRGPVRFRVINGGSHAMQLVSVDTKEMTVVAADGSPIRPLIVQRFPIHNGQRYDVMIDFSNVRKGQPVWFRAEMDTKCFAIQDPTLDPTALLELHIEEERGMPPTTRAWSQTMPGACKDLDESTMLEPAQQTVESTPTRPGAVYIFNSVLGTLHLQNGSQISRYQFNGETFTNRAYRPLLKVASEKQTISRSDVSSIIIEDNAWVVDVVINNRDAAIDHPYHLHGMEFAIVSRGQGGLDMNSYHLKGFNRPNPLRRDTLTIPANSHAILRLDASVKGVWPLHCHIAWHLSQGFMAAVVIHPEAIALNRGQIWPLEAQDLCSSDLSKGSSINATELPR